MLQKKITTRNSGDTARLFGEFDRNTRKIEEEFGVRVYNIQNEGDGDTIVIEGEDADVESAAEAVGSLKRTVERGEDLTEQTVDYTIGMVKTGMGAELDYGDDCFLVTPRGKPIKAKTVGQRKYLDMIRKNTVVLCSGPAGTGKTYLAVAAAVKALRAREVTRIILSRPAVEAGERLGFLPGDLQSKIDPYLRPLYDALYDMMGPETCMKLMEKMTIEIAPLAYMRGRTLDDSFIILDEAQNTTPEQMKMFLTRLGSGSKAVVTGDLTQTDIPSGTRSGMAIATHILRGIDDIGIMELSERDVVRHRLVQRIIVAYDKYDRERAVREAERRERNTVRFRQGENRK